MRVRVEWNERMLMDMLSIRLGMSVYEQIASRTRARRHRKILNDDKLDEQVESVRPVDDDDDDDDRASVILQVRFGAHDDLSSLCLRLRTRHSIQLSRRYITVI